MQNSVKFIEDMPSPRVIKTHLPLEMLPPNLLDTAKVVWVNRNVKDSVVSFYHHEQLLPTHGLTAPFEEYAKLYMEGKTVYGSYWTFMQVGKYLITRVTTMVQEAKCQRKCKRIKDLQKTQEMPMYY